MVEFYHSLMRRDSRRDSGGGGNSDAATSANARDMIGEIENRSTHLLAVSFAFTFVIFLFFFIKTLVIITSVKYNNKKKQIPP